MDDGLNNKGSFHIQKLFLISRRIRQQQHESGKEYYARE